MNNSIYTLARDYNDDGTIKVTLTYTATLTEAQLAELEDMVAQDAMLGRRW